MSIGELIKSIAEQKHVSATELGNLIGCERKNIYKIFEKSSLNTTQLALISKALDHNFFEDIAKDQKLSGIDDPEAIREFQNRMAVSQFVEVMPQVLKKLGKESTICFGGVAELDIPLPDYCLGGYDIEFSLDSLLCDKPNCNFGNAINIRRVKCEEIGIDIDLWQFTNSLTNWMLFS